VTAVPSHPAVASALEFSDRPGFLFWCSHRSIDLIKRTGVMAASEELEVAVKMIGHGTPLLLYHMDERRVYGMFMAIAPATREPSGAFTGSLLPLVTKALSMHVRAMLCVECPPVTEVEVSPCLLVSACLACFRTRFLFTSVLFTSCFSRNRRPNPVAWNQSSCSSLPFACSPTLHRTSY
jgi:hypothetical protein